jgi:prevent-host-death family protein
MARTSSLEAGENLSDLVDRVASAKERVVLTRAGKEIVAIIPVEDLALVEAMEERVDVEDARAARSEAEERGTLSLAALKQELGL